MTTIDGHFGDVCLLLMEQLCKLAWKNLHVNGASVLQFIEVGITQALRLGSVSEIYDYVTLTEQLRPELGE